MKAYVNFAVPWSHRVLGLGCIPATSIEHFLFEQNFTRTFILVDGLDLFIIFENVHTYLFISGKSKLYKNVAP